MNAVCASGALASAPASALGRHAVRHSELGVVFGGDPAGDAAAEDEPVDQARVRVALQHHPRPWRRQRQTQRMVSLRRPVGQEPAALGPVGVCGEPLGALVRRRRGPSVDPLDVLRHVEQQCLVTERRRQSRIGAFASLVAGHVESRRAAKAVRGDGFEVGRGRLPGHRHGDRSGRLAHFAAFSR